MANLSLPEPIYVISDLHLSDAESENLELFAQLTNPALFQAKALIILGDLFDVWLGDDVVDATGQRVAQQLSTLAKQGVLIYFLPGNRDFLLGERFCKKAGMTLTQEPLILTAPSSGIGLLHGDALCTDDMVYQRFRQKTRRPDWQQRILSMPAWVRRLLARFARWKSRRHSQAIQNGHSAISDVTPISVESIISRYGLTHLIHGHTHRIGIHPMPAKQARRWVLGDWHKGIGSVIRIEQTQIGLYEIKATQDTGVLKWSRIEPPSGR